MALHLRGIAPSGPAPAPPKPRLVEGWAIYDPLRDVFVLDSPPGSSVVVLAHASERSARLVAAPTDIVMPVRVVAA